MSVQRNGALLKIDNLSLAINGTPILRCVNAEINDIVGRGQVCGLLGPSGVGKTQLFRIIAGLRSPTGAKIEGQVLLGQDLQPTRAGKVGVVTQNYLLFEHHTVLDNLLIAGRQGGLKSEEAKAKAWGYLGRFQLNERAKYYPAQLSGGQRQRIAIAQQLMCSEHFLLMDEPFSGLDLIMIEEVCQLIHEVQALHELNTIIVVTHDVTAAASVSDTLWLMGLDHQPDGTAIPGARIQHQYDFLSSGFSWRPGISLEPAFNDAVREIKGRFKALAPSKIKAAA